MKATQKDFRTVARRAARQCRIFFFCGPDEAGASAAALQVLELLDHPGERIELSGAALRKDPVLLGDEARSTSLFGGSRHIYVRANGEEAHDALKILIDNTDEFAGDAAPVLVVATSATDKSRTAKLLAKRDDALVAMFWPPDLGSVSAAVRSMADAAGLRLNGDIAERIARGAGLDVRLAQSEITKLALYLDASQQSPRNADAEALEAIGATTEEDGFMPLVNAVLSGETGKLAGELKRMRDLSLNPVGLLLAFERRTAQLAQLSAKLGSSRDAERLVDAEKRAHRIFWKDQRDITNQLGRWQGKKLELLIERMIELHRELLANSAAGELLLAQALARIARSARGKG
ncbi:DNA polymerase III subunit delta [Altererythrobacter aquiaggeris]|uniref:DNA polymerase III subunit delta n=1 Tax=Aestuarierythrobacter aquiaggeris TaxID=1898396 RepID=UPI003019518A